MTPEFFEEFPPLWDQFERVLKESYIKRILDGALEKADPRAHDLSNVYAELGWVFWCSRGIGEPWKTRFEEAFFEKQYYGLERKLYYYDGLDALVTNNLQGKNGCSEALLKQAHFWEKRKRAQTLYDQALKPCLDARKQELLDGFRELARELGQPIPYHMELPQDGNVIAVALEFQSKCRKKHVGKGMDGYTYSFNGRSYRDYESLWAGDAETIAPGVFLGKDSYGESVLETRRDLPTFDSGDREWNSRVMEFLFFDGANVQLLIVQSGYKIASLTFYETLLSADSRLKPLFQRLGWPLSGIGWKEEA